ncbi:MAG: VWA domain-containing protein [Chloroflexi bacterium]|nr:VWA domain-containing protein [Chloroflexota bacterium]
MAKRKARRKRTTGRSQRLLFWVLGLALAVFAVCGGSIWLLVRREPAPANRTVSSSRREVVLRIAYTPEKREAFEALVADYNATKPRLPGGKRVRIEAVPLEADLLVEQALQNTFQAISPDSSIWLEEIDRLWQKERAPEALLVGERTHYMVSPIVIAMWHEVATQMGYPERMLGWQDLLSAAVRDPDFTWSHPSPTTASGLLAILATFYAASGTTRGLTEEQATAPATLEYVRQLEATVKHYGEGELAVMQHIEEQGRAYLDAFVVPEQLVVQYNLRHPEQLLAIYPLEGTLWQDHPLALLEHPDRTDEERQAYALFKEYLLSEPIQRKVLQFGYRPADVRISLESPESPIRPENGADPQQPHTTLQVPSAGVIEVVKNVWWYTKRPANVYLVVDTSGSMAGRKLSDAQAALHLFLEEVRGPEDRVGLISFADRPHERVPLMRMEEGRARLSQEVEALEAGGNTALLDSVLYALERLEALNDTGRINAIVVMTDGQENASAVSREALLKRLEEAYRSGLRVVVFCVAYGRTADMKTLEAISSAAGGFTSTSEPETIRALYKALSTYF